MELPFFTIGHSTRTIEAFVELLRAADVTLVVDIRTVPRSRTNPQYNQESLPESLAAYRIGYERIAELGGLRGRSKESDPAVNGFWDNKSFHNYADYALTDAFSTGLARLTAVGHTERCAMMCSEAVWWRCHRRIVADHLIVSGEQVFHLMGKDTIDPASLTRGAQISDDGALTYPAESGHA